MNLKPSVPLPLVNRIVTASNTTLFALAAQYLGDATRWNEIAAANGLIDPWIGPALTINIPVSQGISNGGILGL